MDSPEVHLYTDGSARGNPGPGGYGLILEWVGKGYVREFSQGYRMTTNNRMELMAVIEGLARLKVAGARVTVFTDSRYVSDAVEKGWLARWQRTGFKGKKNPDLWRRYLEAAADHHVRFRWIKGHNDHPQNERCDHLAVQAALNGPLIEDTGYRPAGPE